jgi:hypothetical protein
MKTRVVDHFFPAEWLPDMPPLKPADFAAMVSEARDQFQFYMIMKKHRDGPRDGHTAVFIDSVQNIMEQWWYDRRN